MHVTVHYLLRISSQWQPNAALRYSPAFYGCRTDQGLRVDHQSARSVGRSTELTLADRAAPPAGSDEDSPVDFEIGRPSAMRRRLASEIGAAIAHELNGPMTALLLYVGDIQHSIDLLADRSLKQVAVLEAERIFGLIHKLGDLFEAPIRNDNAICVARNAIDWSRATPTRKAPG
jgi:signal transduction histidine kinase